MLPLLHVNDVLPLLFSLTETAQQKKLFESHKIFKMNQLKCVSFFESCWLINLWSNDDAIETLIRMHSRNDVLMHFRMIFLAFIGFFSIRFDFSSAYVIPRGLMMVWSEVDAEIKWIISGWPFWCGMVLDSLYVKHVLSFMSILWYLIECRDSLTSSSIVHMWCSSINTLIVQIS